MRTSGHSDLPTHSDFSQISPEPSEQIPLTDQPELLKRTKTTHANADIGDLFGALMTLSKEQRRYGELVSKAARNLLTEAEKVELDALELLDSSSDQVTGNLKPSECLKGEEAKDSDKSVKSHGGSQGKIQEVQMQGSQVQGLEEIKEEKHEDKLKIISIYPKNDISIGYDFICLCV